VDIFFSYDYGTNTTTQLKGNQHVQYAASAAIDPVRKLMIFMGSEYATPTVPRIYAVDISPGSTYTVQDWSSQATGCNVMGASSYPGMAYSATLGRILGWPNTGNSVYVFNPDTKTCTVQSFPNGPQNAAHSGTYGRFQYFPALDAFALVSDAGLNAFLFRLNSSGGTTSPCDLNGDGRVDTLDVQSAINQALGISSCTMQLTGQCSVIDVQRVINASLGGVCKTGP
jgi:hypothetical protein